MADNITNTASSIGMALAGKTAFVDIPKPQAAGARGGKDSFAAVDAKSLPPGKTRRAGLPTPPNSISPTLPPQAYKERENSEPLTPPAHSGESDIDLQDAVEHAAAQDQPERRLAHGSLAALDTAGAITPTLLATHHLPEILLEHGPLAIRHIMGYLTTSVPGFSGIQPAKARRLVVGALTGRGGTSGEAAGGIDGDVLFEKVGWGRWDARRRGQASRHPQRHVSPTSVRHAAPGSVRSYSPYDPKALRIPHRPRQSTRPRLASANSASRSHDSSDLPLDHDAQYDDEDMSLDEEDASHSARGSSCPPDDVSLSDDPDDETDEEDWAAIGAAALRTGSYPKGASGGRPGKVSDPKTGIRRDSGSFARSCSSTHLAKSVPGIIKVQLAYRHRGEERREKKRERGVSRDHHRSQLDRKPRDPMEGVGEDENEAVQALLKLGSM